MCANKHIVPFFTFSTKAERASHPLASKINPHLIEHHFNKRLSLLEMDTLQSGVKALKKIDSKDYGSNSDRARLFLCLLLSGQFYESFESLINFAKNELCLEANFIAHLSLLAGNFRVVKQLIPEVSRSYIELIVTSWDCIESILSSGQFEAFKQYLELEIHPGKKVQDLLTTTDYLHLYQKACKNGHLNFINYLSEKLGEDEVEAIKEKRYSSYRRACKNGHLNVIDYLSKKLGEDEIKAIRAKLYSIYRYACKYEQQDVINYLSKKLGKDEIKAIKAYRYAAYRHACKNGRLNVIDYLSKKLGEDEVNAIEADNYFAYRYACANGHRDVIDYLSQKLGVDEINAIRANYYSAYQLACEGGHQDIIEYLGKKLNNDESNAIQEDYYRAYRQACAGGHQGVIDYLSKKLGVDESNAIQANNYFAYQFAFTNEHQDIIDYLSKKLGEDEIIAIQTNNYDVYRYACESGNLNAIDYLSKKLGEDEIIAIQTDNYFAYRYACEYGNLNVIDYLSKKLGEDEVNAIEADNYFAYRYACANGHRDVIDYLSKKLGVDEINAIRADYYSAYQLACEGGHQDIIEYLGKKLNNDESNAIQEDNYRAYWYACAGGHQGVIDYLSKKLGEDEINAIQANNYFAYRSACENKHYNIAKYQLKSPACFNYAEKHDREYGKKLIYDVVSLKLNSYRKQKQQFDNESPNGVFDLEEQEGKYAFLMLRNLIRRGVERYYTYEEIRQAEALNDEINFLLSIPSVRNLCHQTVTFDDSSPGQENELLRFATRIGNQNAVSILLHLPDVRRIAEANDFYANEVRGNMDLRQIARDRESSMVALSPAEKETVEKVRKHYQAEIKDIEEVFGLLKSQLRARYEDNPAILKADSYNNLKEDITLPFEWGELQTLRKNLSELQYQQALTTYYQHDAHTAYRYLSKPNYWMDTNAPYVYVYYDENGKTQYRYSSYEDYKALISLFFWAAFDKKAPGIDGYSIDDRMTLFIKQLALIGRAHNWDNKRPLIINGKKQYDAQGNALFEEYDDLCADRASCYSGVNRRLFQSVLGHPVFKTLTSTIAIQALDEHIRAYYEFTITAKNCKQLFEASNNLVELEGDYEDNLSVLRELNISHGTQQAMIDKALIQLIQTYGEQPEELKANFKQQMQEHFNDIYGNNCHYTLFAGRLDLHGLLEKKMTRYKKDFDIEAPYFNSQHHVFFSEQQSQKNNESIQFMSSTP